LSELNPVDQVNGIMENWNIGIKKSGTWYSIIPIFHHSIVSKVLINN